MYLPDDSALAFFQCAGLNNPLPVILWLAARMAVSPTLTSMTIPIVATSHFPAKYSKNGSASQMQHLPVRPVAGVFVFFAVACIQLTIDLDLSLLLLFAQLISSA
jgi:hypothetical protein